jgi:hypothetical protein
VIDPQLCTECVGFHDHEACAAVCPVDCCVPDPNIVESEEVLIARARALHQDTNFGDNFPSRFRKGSAEQPPPAITPPGAAEPASAQVQEAKPVSAVTATALSSDSNPVAPESKEASTVKPSTGAAPAGNGESKPAAAAAAPAATPGPAPGAASTEAKRASGGKPQADPAAAANGEAKPAAPTAQAVAPPPPAKDAAKAPAPKAPVKAEQRPKKTFPGELPVSFQDLSSQYNGKPSGGSLSKGLPKLLIILLQPILGALPHDMKKALEAEVQSPLFTAAGSTGLNILHNAVLYPLVAMALAAITHGPAIIFSQEINVYLLIGIGVAVAEGVYRLKDGVVRLKSADDMTLPAALYGVPLGIALRPILQKRRGVIRDLPIPVDGFYSAGFVEKLERERRYGNVYTVEDRGKAILVKMQFPRLLPEIGLAERAHLPDEMPDYDYDLSLRDRQLMVKGRCVDERVRKLSSSIGAFPPEFTTVIPLQEKVVGFGHHFANKCLEILLVKGNGDQAGASHR